MSDLEQRLRATLHERSGDITSVPPHRLDGAPPTGRPRWMLPSAAAAAVLLVAGTALAVRASTHHDSAPPAAPSCITDLPDAWHTAIDGTGQNVTGNDQALALLPDGTMIVQEQGGDATFDNGTMEAVFVSGSNRALLQLPLVADLHPLVWAVGGSRFVIAMTVIGPHNATHTMAIYLVDAVSGTRTTIARADSAHVIGGVAVLGGAVFYDVHPEEVANGGTVQAYDIAEARHRVEYRGSVIGTVTGTPIGVDWGSGSIDADLPDNVKSALTDDAVTDGTAYAVVGRGGIVWADRDGTVRGPFEQHAADTPVINGVDGPYAFFHDDVSDDLYVLDTRTNAVANTGQQQIAPVPSAGGYIALSWPARSIDTNGLPELRC